MTRDRDHHRPHEVFEAGVGCLSLARVDPFPPHLIHFLTAFEVCHVLFWGEPCSAVLGAMRLNIADPSAVHNNCFPGAIWYNSVLSLLYLLFPFIRYPLPHIHY